MSTKERAFLHELMNLLTIADGNCRRMGRSISNGELENLPEYLDKVQTSIFKIVAIAQHRRDVLIDLSEDEKKSGGLI
ncbi:MAG: hypothetical protein ACOYL6_12255 [Bacteriovoracaceae bacterium]